MLELHGGMKVCDELQGRCLVKDVESDVALDAEAIGCGVQLGGGAELDGVGGDREVGVAAEARVVASAERDVHARQVGQPLGRGEARVESADRHDERRAGAATQLRPQRHRPRQRELLRQAGVHEHSVDRHVALVEVQYAEHIEVDP